MKETINTLEGIRDIAPPAIPWQVAWENVLAGNNTPGIMLVGLFALIIFVVLLRLVWQRYLSPRGKARRRIVALQRAHHAQTIDSHHTAFQLSHILREALPVAQLSTQTPLPEKLHTHKTRWQTFIAHLSVARYARREDAQVGELLADAQFWLAQWPHKSND
jgi:hypothetical protein